MTEEQIRLDCMEIALLGMSNNPKGEPQDRAETFALWVQSDETRLGCLRLAIKKHGSNARIGVDGILKEAVQYLSFVSPPNQVEKSFTARKVGRPRKKKF